MKTLSVTSALNENGVFFVLNFLRCHRDLDGKIPLKENAGCESRKARFLTVLLSHPEGPRRLYCHRIDGLWSCDRYKASLVSSTRTSNSGLSFGQWNRFLLASASYDCLRFDDCAILPPQSLPTLPSDFLWVQANFCERRKDSRGLFCRAAKIVCWLQSFDKLYVFSVKGHIK